MKRYLWRGLAVVGAVAGWEVGASWLMCAGTKHPEAFVFPYDQWLQAAWFSKSMFWLPKIKEIPNHPLLWFVLTSIMGLMVLAIVASIVRRVAPQPSLFGNSQWATPAHMLKHGISRDKVPF